MRQSKPKDFISASVFCIAKTPTSFYFAKTKRIPRLFNNAPNASVYAKDGINEFIINGQNEAVNPTDENGKRAAFGDSEKFQTDEHWRDLLLFHEYFDGDTGKGLGAAHQTGWTGLVAKLLQQNGE